MHPLLAPAALPLLDSLAVLTWEEEDVEAVALEVMADCLELAAVVELCLELRTTRLVDTLAPEVTLEVVWLSDLVIELAISLELTAVSLELVAVSLEITAAPLELVDIFLELVDMATSWVELATSVTVSLTVLAAEVSLAVTIAVAVVVEEPAVLVLAVTSLMAFVVVEEELTSACPSNLASCDTDLAA
jgi:hypothetical protein